VKNFFDRLPNIVNFNQILAALVALLNFGIVLISIRLVVDVSGIEAWGLWAFFMAIMGIIRLFDFLGITSLHRMIAVSEQNASKQISYLDTMAIAVSAFYTTVIIITYFIYFNILNSGVEEYENRFLFVMCATIFFLNAIYIVHQSAMDGFGFLRERCYIYILASAFCLMCTLYLVPKYGLIGYVVSQATLYVFFILLSRFYLRRHISSLSIFPHHFKFKSFFECLGYGARLEISIRAKMVFDVVIRIIVGASVGLEALGIYDICYKAVIQVLFFINSFMAPKLYYLISVWKENPNNIYVIFDNLNSKYSLFMLIFFPLFVIFSPLLSIIVFDEVNFTFVFLFILLTSGHLLNALIIPLQLLAQTLAKFRWSIFGQVVLLASGVALYVLFRGQHTVTHLALLVAVSTTCSAIVELAGLMRELPVSASGFRLRSYAFIYVLFFLSSWALFTHM